VNRRRKRNHLVSDADSKNTDVLPFDSCNLIIQFISIVCRYTVRDEHDNLINARSLSISRIKHFQSCYLETAGRVRVLAEILNSVHGRQHLVFRRVVLQVEVQLSLVA